MFEAIIILTGAAAAAAAIVGAGYINMQQMNGERCRVCCSRLATPGTICRACASAELSRYERRHGHSRATNSELVTTVQ